MALALSSGEANRLPKYETEQGLTRVGGLIFRDDQDVLEDIQTENQVETCLYSEVYGHPHGGPKPQANDR